MTDNSLCELHYWNIGWIHAYCLLVPIMTGQDLGPCWKVNRMAYKMLLVQEKTLKHKFQFLYDIESVEPLSFFTIP